MLILAFSDALEEVTDNDLSTYQREHGYADTHSSGSHINQLLVTRKDGRYGMRKQFADDKARTGDTYARNDAQTQCRLYTVVFLRSEVIAHDEAACPSSVPIQSLRRAPAAGS